MSIMKDETTARLDDLHRDGMEALGVFDDLARRIDDDDLRDLVAAHADAQRELLERIATVRRARGEMPHAGDPERSHLEAAGAVVRAALLPGRNTTHYVETLLEAARNVERHVDAALSLDLDAQLRRVLEAFRADNVAFDDALRRHNGYPAGGP